MVGGLQRQLPDLTQSTLTKQLRALEEYGLIERKIYPQVPPKVEYSLSDIGIKLKKVLAELSESLIKTLVLKEKIVPQLDY